MGYSKIVAWEVINFMSFEKARVEFDGTNIVNLKGYNDSGKSALLRALSVCLMDKYRNKQAKFIRDGSDYFRIVVYFDDGVSIVRDKYLNGQSLYELYLEGKLVFTTKQGNKLTKIDGVPEVIKEYLGLCVTDSVYLNYQTNEEKLPFVDTTGSENYRAFHEVLRMEELYRASNMINVDRRELNGEIAQIEFDLRQSETSLSKCDYVTKELIAKLEEVEKECTKTNEKLNSLKALQEYAKNISNIIKLPKLDTISSERLADLLSIKDCIEHIDSLKVTPEVPKVSYERLNDLVHLGNILDNLDSYKSIPTIPKFDVMLIDRSKDIKDLNAVFGEFVKAYNNSVNIENNLIICKEELQGLFELAKEKGIELTKCSNCGSYTVVGGHMHE